MSERTLRDCHVLVVEDEYMLADELRTELEEAGAVVIGPVAVSTRRWNGSVRSPVSMALCSI